MQPPHSIESVLDTQQKKLAFFQNLILVAAADGKLDKHESNFLVEIGNKLGLSPEEVMPIADNLGVLSFIIPEEGLQKTLELQTLVQMMLQDGQLHDREYGLCLDYTYRIGYGKAVLDDIIQQFSSDRATS
jgi:hypothetical protein